MISPKDEQEFTFDTDTLEVGIIREELHEIPAPLITYLIP